MSRSCKDISELLEAAKRIRLVDRESVDLKTEKLLEELRRCFVIHYFLDELVEARTWIKMFQNIVRKSVAAVNAKNVLLPKEFRSFVIDPLHHLSKKLFNYVYEFARGRLDEDSFLRVAEAAVRTSLRSNLRSLYENWVFLALVYELGTMYNARIVFPEHMHILLERSGRQRSGGIPPNLILALEGRGYISFFLEAPRPIGWGDTRDLAKSWKFYVALRPDLLVYSGRIVDIVVPKGDPPILQPTIIIECKELEDWYLRTREVRGPFAEPMTAEEWRNRWLRGLWAGLADILGVDNVERAYEVVKRKKGIRLREPQIVKLYAKLYRPRTMFLVSRRFVPSWVKSELEADNIVVIDDVGFNEEKLKELVDELEKIASYEGVDVDLVPVRRDDIEKLDKLMMLTGLKSREELVSALIRYVWVHRDEFVKEFTKHQKSNS
ncbi:MAG TPA: hypothetical protein EYH59_03060 [Pyrodictium sp.]|nr:hypothetical protein [Pyrodictium sp.]